jgi:hypothetical protein
MLNHRDFITKARIKYTDGQQLTFYNRFRNIGQQYGILLISIDTIKYGETLCPKDYNGIQLPAVGTKPWLLPSMKN